MRITDEEFGDASGREIGLSYDDASVLASYIFGVSPDLPNLRIAGYSVIRELGRGGHGVVFLANKERSEHHVAIKVLRGDPRTDRAVSKRLWRELESLERCRSPHVPRVLDYGSAHGHHFIVCEFVDGIPIDLYARANARSTKEKMRLLVQACDAVQELHEYGLIHRDLKPSNLLVTRQGEVKLIDLGTACLLEGRSDESRTLEGTVLGTPACMAP